MSALRREKDRSHIVPGCSLRTKRPQSLTRFEEMGTVASDVTSHLICAAVLSRGSIALADEGVRASNATHCVLS